MAAAKMRAFCPQVFNREAAGFQRQSLWPLAAASGILLRKAAFLWFFLFQGEKKEPACRAYIRACLRETVVACACACACCGPKVRGKRTFGKLWACFLPGRGKTGQFAILRPVDSACKNRYDYNANLRDKIMINFGLFFVCSRHLFHHY